MKKHLKTALSLICAGTLALVFTGCSSGKCVKLAAPAEVKEFNDFTDAGYKDINERAREFAYKFSAAAYSEYGSGNNFSVAPISVYSALALAAECASGDTRSEILSALGADYDGLNANYCKLYRAMNLKDEYREGKFRENLILSNSVWLNKSVNFNDSCLKNLANNYFAYSYSADFRDDNENANKAVRAFVKDSTKGLIDCDFKLSPRTVFTLINTLYLKDIWNTYGDELGFTDEKYAFTQLDGSKKQLNLLKGYYLSGRAQHTEKYSTFFTRTYRGFNIKFIVPNDGYTVRDVFTEASLAAVNGLKDFGAVDDANKVIYRTRCLFPEFKTSYNEDISGVLHKNFGVNSLFDVENCDFSNLTADGAYCEKVQHVNTLTVNKKGIEGAAVTVIAADGTGGPGEYKNVYEDFVIDRAFGFILTDGYGNVIFTGTVNAV